MNRGRAESPSYLKALSEALEVSVHSIRLAQLSDTDRLTAVFRDGYQATLNGGVPGFGRTFSWPETKIVHQMADCLAARVGSESAYLLTKQAANCGAAEVSLAYVLNHVEAIIGVDGDSVSVLSLNGDQGMLIDRNDDDKAEYFEIAIWGDRWPQSAHECFAPHSPRVNG